MLFQSDRLAQLKIYYLFTHADGDLSSYEKDQLDDIAKKLDLDELYLQEYQDFCKEIDSSKSITNVQKIVTEIRKVLEEGLSKEAQAQTLWTLINLGYADRDFSQEERLIVKFLTNQWKVDSTLVDEFYDIANTLMALTSQKEWVMSLSKPYSEVDPIVKEIDRSMESVFSMVETTLSEVEIA